MPRNRYGPGRCPDPGRSRPRIARTQTDSPPRGSRAGFTRLTATGRWRGARRPPQPNRRCQTGLACPTLTSPLVHVPVRHGRSRRGLLLGDVGDQRFGGQQQRGDRRRVLQRHPLDLGRIDDAGLQHVHVLHAVGVEAARGDRLRLHLLYDHAALEAGVLDDLTDRLLERPLDNHGAHLLVALELLEIVDGLRAAQQGHAAARNDAFLHRGAGRVERVLDAGLLLLHRGLGRGADLDDGHAAGQLGQPLLQLLAVVVARRLLDLGADLLDAALDRGRLAGALDDRGVVLVHDHLLRLAEILELDVLELDAEILGDGLATGEGRDVFQHGLAAVAAARRPYGAGVRRAAELVDDQGGQRLALHRPRDAEG